MRFVTLEASEVVSPGHQAFLATSIHEMAHRAEDEVVTSPLKAGLAIGSIAALALCAMGKETRDVLYYGAMSGLIAKEVRSFAF